MKKSIIVKKTHLIDLFIDLSKNRMNSCLQKPGIKWKIIINRIIQVQISEFQQESLLFSECFHFESVNEHYEIGQKNCIVLEIMIITLRNRSSIFIFTWSGLRMGMKSVFSILARRWTWSKFERTINHRVTTVCPRESSRHLCKVADTWWLWHRGHLP